MKTINLSQDKVSIVDDEDYLWINKNKWSYICGYARRNDKHKILLLHREIFKYYGIDIENKEIDHIDRNKLNNTKSNLRVVNRSENVINTGIKSNNRSGYKYISWHRETRPNYKSKGHWRVSIIRNKKSIFDHAFKDIKLAIKARNKILKERNELYSVI